jgi:hypothetical protein
LSVCDESIIYQYQLDQLYMDDDSLENNKKKAFLKRNMSANQGQTYRN